MNVFVFGTRGFPGIQGGVEKHCESLYPKLVSKSNSITVFRRRPYVVQDKKLKNRDIKFIDLPSTRIKGFEAFFHSFLCTCISIYQHPDIVHIHNIGPAMFSPLLKWRGIKVVLTYHSPNYEHAKWGYIARLILKISEHLALNYADAILFVNKFQMEKYDSEVKSRSYYIPNGVDECAMPMTMDYLKSLNLEPKKYILAVGRITPEKGFDVLIDAFDRLNTTDCCLVIAGGVEHEGTYRDKLKKMARKKQIIFTGYVFGDKLHQLYYNALLFVLPSYNEGFPLVLLEAMSYHCDVLVSDIPATHLVKLTDTDYFKAGSTEELAEALKRKLSSPCPCRYYDLSEYDWSIVAGKTNKVYSRVYNKNSK